MIHQLSCAGKTEKVSFILSELAESHIISTQHRIIILQIVILISMIHSLLVFLSIQEKNHGQFTKRHEDQLAQVHEVYLLRYL